MFFNSNMKTTVPVHPPSNSEHPIFEILPNQICNLLINKRLV